MAQLVTFDTVLELAQQLDPADQARLVATLEGAAPKQADSKDAYPALAPEVRQLLAGMSIDDMVVAPQGTMEEALALLEPVADEGEDGDEENGESWDDVLRSLDAHRFSTRQLFPDIQKP
jgi:hypothetical protein